MSLVDVAGQVIVRGGCGGTWCGAVFAFFVVHGGVVCLRPDLPRSSTPPPSTGLGNNIWVRPKSTAFGPSPAASFIRQQPQIIY